MPAYDNPKTLWSFAPQANTVTTLMKNVCLLYDLTISAPLEFSICVNIANVSFVPFPSCPYELSPWAYIPLNP